MKVKALTRLADPASYWNSDTGFMGNVDLSKAMKEQLDNVKAFLITVTDNGGGGQPVSMGNFKEVVKFAHSHGIIVWVDACRIFENALFIHLFEDGYHERSILDIVQEMLADADIITVSYKKMYAHSGGGILLRKDSSLIEPYIGSVKKHVQEVTTTGYGLGFDAGYSGLTGMEMIEIITGLFEAINPNRIADRILQPIQISAKLKEAYGLPITGGGHAMYVAADQVLPNVKETNCPAEYLNALLITALFARGCGLGNFLYGGRKELGNGRAELTTQVSMDSLRLAIPRGSYSTSLLYEVLSVIGIAYKEKLFQNVDGGLVPDFYEGDGFDHFKVKFKAIKEGEFDRLVSKLNQILRNKLSSLLS
jgi:tryptophanase